jgi:hypothetical protein
MFPFLLLHALTSLIVPFGEDVPLLVLEKGERTSRGGWQLPQELVVVQRSIRCTDKGN